MDPVSYRQLAWNSHVIVLKFEGVRYTGHGETASEARAAAEAQLPSEAAPHLPRRLQQLVETARARPRVKDRSGRRVRRAMVA